MIEKQKHCIDLLIVFCYWFILNVYLVVGVDKHNVIQFCLFRFISDADFLVLVCTKRRKCDIKCFLILAVMIIVRILIVWINNTR